MKRIYYRSIISSIIKRLCGMVLQISIRQRYGKNTVPIFSYPFEAMVVTLAVGSIMALEANLEFIRTAVAAIEDHDAFAGLWRKSSGKVKYFEMDPGLNF